MAIEPPVKLLLSYPEAAQALGVSRSKLEKLVHTGQIASLQIGTRRLFDVRDVYEWIDRQKVVQAVTRE